MSGCDHTWAREHPGRPLYCELCGEVWPASPGWPPTAFAERNPGAGDMAGPIAWSRGIEAVKAMPL